MKVLYDKPSFYAHILNAIIILATIILALQNMNLINNTNIINKLVLLLLLSISIGIHQLSHLGLESIYNYNILSDYL